MDIMESMEKRVKGNRGIRVRPSIPLFLIPNTIDSDLDAKYLIYFISFNHQLNNLDK